MQRQVTLSTGADLRLTGAANGPAVLCVNGGQRADVPGTWSATLEWLVTRLALRFPNLVFGEVRYRLKSWQRLDLCIADARAALAAVAAQRTILVGFSMGGAVAVRVADAPEVEAVVALAPWLPGWLPMDTLRGKRLAVVHGSLDRYLPGIPGVDPAGSRRGFERARDLGVEGDYELLRGAVHGVALRAPWGEPVPLPRAGAWLNAVARELSRLTG